MFSITDVARILKVSTEVIKEWTHTFSEFISQYATSVNKGTYTIDDIRVMSYVFMFWEDEPDIECIKIGLSSNSHYQHELIDNLIVEITPFFSEVTDSMDESWKHGVLFGGLAEIGDMFFLANSYKFAGDTLIEAALRDEQAWELFCPAVYNYRHAIELYLKALTGDDKKKHDLKRLYIIFEKMMIDQFNSGIPDWFKNLIDAIGEFDPAGTTFRYGGNLNRDEVFIDFIQLKKLMCSLSHSFQNIRKHQGMPDATF